MKRLILGALFLALLLNQVYAAELAAAYCHKEPETAGIGKGATEGDASEQAIQICATRAKDPECCQLYGTTANVFAAHLRTLQGDIDRLQKRPAGNKKCLAIATNGKGDWTVVSSTSDGGLDGILNGSKYLCQGCSIRLRRCIDG